MPFGSEENGLTTSHAVPREVTSTTFDRETKSTPVAVVDFWAAWCVPCKRFAVVLDGVCEQISAKYPGKASFLKLDVDKDGAMAEKFGVMTIPTVIGFRGGAMVGRYTGNRTKEDFATWVERLIAG